jgi:hypothetical protein
MENEDVYVCVFCEKRIWKDTDGWRHESSGSMPICNATPEPKTTITCPQCEGVPEMCNGYCEGTGTVTTNHAAEWHRQNDEPKAGKTLADFANGEIGKLFKRRHHAVAYTFASRGSGHLKEIMPDGTISLPRLTAEDLTATDWEEVK